MGPISSERRMARSAAVDAASTMDRRLVRPQDSGAERRLW